MMPKFDPQQTMINWDAYNAVEPRDPMIDPVDKKRVSRQSMKILHRLREGPATNGELAGIALNYTARLSNLRDAGYNIRAKRKSGGTFEYTLIG